jgi:diacylglycerol kinase family enzyme
MTRHRIIINPTAGRGSAQKLAPVIEKELTSHGIEFEIVHTSHPWHAAELAQQGVVRDLTWSFPLAAMAPPMKCSMA